MRTLGRVLLYRVLGASVNRGYGWSLVGKDTAVHSFLLSLSLCVCVIINKRSFEPFMCLDLVANCAQPK